MGMQGHRFETRLSEQSWDHKKAKKAKQSLKKFFFWTGQLNTVPALYQSNLASVYNTYSTLKKVKYSNVYSNVDM